MIIAVDTETRGLDTREFVCGSLVTEKGREEIFYNRTDMFNTIINIIEKEIKRGKKTYIYAHNHEYDWYTYARDNWTKKGIKYLNFHPFIVIYKDKGYFLDSHAIFSMSLEKLGIMIGQPKGKTHPKLFNDEEEITPEDMKEITEYCLNDSKIVLNAILHLREKLGDLGYRPRRLVTAGQIAMSTFVSHLRRYNLWFEITNIGKRGEIVGTKYDNFVRTGFRGARNEAFKVGSYENVTAVDINSLYPFIMAYMPFPDLKSERMINDPLRKMSLEAISNYIGFADCTMKIPEIEYGYLPVRYKNMILFPFKEGLKLRSVWTIREIMKAIELGYELEKINKCLLFDRGNNIFSKYMEDLYKERKKSNEAEGLVIKLIMSNLFGKFGQKKIKKEMKFVYRADLPDTGWDIEGCLGNQYVISREEEYKRRYFVNPSIPALITAHARDYLYSFLERIDIDDILYCDTDSIITKNFNKYKHLFDIGGEMGEWKYVFKNKNIEIRGEKKYRVEDIVKLSGLKKPRNKEEAEQIKSDFITGRMHTKRIISMKQGMKMNREIGTFTDIDSTLSIGCKREIEIKEKIIRDRRDKNG